MWSEDPGLAHEVLAADGRQWSGQTAALDTVVGPAEQVGFVQAYRAAPVNVFTRRLLVDGGSSFAYLWDVRLADGTIHTGLDVNVVRDGLVADNGTFVAARASELPDPDASTGARPLDAAGLGALAARWVAVWSGDVEQAQGLVTDDFQALVRVDGGRAGGSGPGGARRPGGARAAAARRARRPPAPGAGGRRRPPAHRRAVDRDPGFRRGRRGSTC